MKPVRSIFSAKKDEVSFWNMIQSLQKSHFAFVMELLNSQSFLQSSTFAAKLLAGAAYIIVKLLTLTTNKQFVPCS